MPMVRIPFLAVAAALLVGMVPARAAALDPTKAVVIELRTHIDDFQRNRIIRQVEQAKALGAGTVIFDLDTPGGLVTSSKDLSGFIKNQTGLHTIAFINSTAYSGGTMLALACNEILMRPSAAFGDCAPIAITSTGQLVPLPDAERAKQEGPIIADFAESATLRRYDLQLVLAMIDVRRVVHWIQDEQGNRRIVDAEEYKALNATGQWKPVDPARNPLDSEHALLTVTTDIAVPLGLAKGTAASAADLASQRGLTIVATLSPGRGDWIVEGLNHPLARMLLISIFLTSLYAALHAPGHGIAEALAMIALGGLLGVPMLTGYAQWWEILLILCGLILLALELFVIPGFGVAGISGALLVLFGLLMTFVGREPGGMPGVLPALSGSWQALQTGLLVLTGGILVSFALSLWLRRYLPRLPYFNRLILQTTAGNVPKPGELANGTIVSDPWPFVGSTGRAVSDLKPGGMAEFPFANDRRTVAVVSESGFIPAGTAIVAREIAGNRILVRKADEA